MLPRLDALTPPPVNGVDRIATLEGVADPRQQALSRSLQTMLGKTLQGEVLSRLTDGSFVVRVAGNAARMQLPPATQLGAEVPLTLVALEPRPTFELAGGGGGRTAALVYLDAAAPDARPAPTLRTPGQPTAPAAQAAHLAGAALGQDASAGAAPSLRPASYAAALLGKAPLTPADRLPPLDADSQPAALSPAARMITSVLNAAPRAPQGATTVVGTLPLLPSPDIAPAKLAAALHEALASSGLFYESHLSEWSAGARPLATLLREPQMQGAFAAVPAHPGQADAALTDPATAQFINQQLSTQEQGRITWQGHLWPGQQMRWEISRDRPGRGAGQDGEAPAAPWRSGVRFSFPLLGEIGATLVLAGDQLHIDVEAASGPVRELLRAHADALGMALAAAGAPLASLTVRTSATPSDA